MNTKNTSWNKVHKWYDSIVGKEGHYYHQEVIFPRLLKLLHLTKEDRLLDIGCGQGVLSRVIPKDIEYVGFDCADHLINSAKSQDRSPHHSFLCFDAMKPWKLETQKPFTKAACILALQNMPSPEMVFKEVSSLLTPKGLFAVVLNHPCFRIPRQSRWGFDEATKTQTRELFSYMTPQEIPITTHPGKGGEEKTWSFHYPLSAFSEMAKGFSITHLEEWVSPKKSQGSAKSYEDRARREFPLFLCLIFRREG